MRKVFLEDLAQKGENINWKASIGKEVRFIYDEIHGVIKILKYISGKNPRVVISYKDFEFNLDITSFKKCRFGGFVNISDGVNLILIPSELNLMKLDKPIDETISMIELLYKNIDNIKKAYKSKEVEI